MLKKNQYRWNTWKNTQDEYGYINWDAVRPIYQAELDSLQLQALAAHAERRRLALEMQI